MKVIKSFIALSLLTLAGCSSMSDIERQQKRESLNTMSEQTIAKLIEQTPAIKQELDNSIAYAVADMKLTKVPVVGAGGGEGMFFDKKTQQRSYFTVSRVDFGGGWGARAYKVLLLIESEDVAKRLKSGTWEFQAGAEASAGAVSAEGSSSDINTGFSMHVLSEAGASVTVTARIIRTKLNRQLTEK